MSADERAARRRASIVGYLQRHKETRREKLCLWRAKNPDKVRAQRRRCRQAHGDKLNQRWREWRLRNLDRERSRSREAKVRKRAHYTALERARREQQRLATPRWAKKETILQIYEEAVRRGLQVDHIVPLRSPIVCGLHWEGNLQMLTAAENASKKNSWWPNMPISRSA